LAWFSQLSLKNAKRRAFCKDLAGLGLKRLGKAAHSAGLADNQPGLNLFAGRRLWAFYNRRISRKPVEGVLFKKGPACSICL
jgi:hypothetical protein